MTGQKLKRTAWNGALLALLGTLATGCFGDPPDARARMAALDAEGKALNASADALEERLVGSQAELQLWSELQRRHHSVSVIAIANSDEHLRQMMRALTAQEEKSRRLRPGSVAAAVQAPSAEDEGPLTPEPEPAYTRIAQSGRRTRTLRP